MGLLPRGSTRWELGHSPRLADLLGRVLVVCSASRTCSAETWSSTPPCRLAWWGLGRPPRLVDLLGGGLVLCFASQTCSVGTWSSISPCRLAQQMGRKEVMGLTLGTPFLGTRQSPLDISKPSQPMSDKFFFNWCHP
jgi:hypothetical protein